MVYEAFFGLLGVIVGAILSGYLTHRSQRQLQNMERQFETWKLKTPLFQPAYDAFEQVRTWGYRLSNRFERLKETQFKDLRDEEKQDFFLVAIRYRNALEKVPLILPTTRKEHTEYREAETAAKALVEKIIIIHIYTRRDAFNTVKDEPSQRIIGSITKDKHMSEIWKDFLNSVAKVDLEEAIKTINKHRLAFVRIIEDWYEGPKFGDRSTESKQKREDQSIERLDRGFSFLVISLTVLSSMFLSYFLWGREEIPGMYAGGLDPGIFRFTTLSVMIPILCWVIVHFLEKGKLLALLKSFAWTFGIVILGRYVILMFLLAYPVAIPNFEPFFFGISLLLSSFGFPIAYCKIAPLHEAGGKWARIGLTIVTILFAVALLIVIRYV